MFWGNIMVLSGGFVRTVAHGQEVLSRSRGDEMCQLYGEVYLHAAER